jgi:DNA-binding NarL/FixJ family response regulator
MDETFSHTDEIDVWAIEDSETYRAAIVRVLNSIPRIRCSGVFSSCEEALHHLRKSPGPRVLLMDINLPGITGIEGIQQIMDFSPSTDIIMLTVINDHPSIMQALCAGATGYLLKTASMKNIAQAIFEVVEGGAPMTPQIARSVLRLFVRHTPAPANYRLSKQEKNVLELLVEGKAKKEVAALLEISYHTVDNHVRAIYRKLHVHSLSAAVAKAIKEKVF